MTDNKTSGDKTLSAPKTLSLKRPVEQGVVKQSFSHGRTKSVVVETVKRRPGTMDPPTRAPVVESKAPAPAPRPAA
ncbi:MAG: IF-2-associated domain-containing protein, partial [Hyphomicrobiales bacterium]|nr:IF-2-associated domain-containing protein [Hyphomicrobiales bacterium]